MEELSFLIAQHLVYVAKENQIIDDNELCLIPELSEVEKKFFIDLYLHFDKYIELKDSLELSLDEISSIFSFVFAKSAEAVTNHINKNEQKFDFMGIFDGKIPVYVDERLIGKLKSSKLPIIMASAYLEFKNEHSELDIDPKLGLFEALKWTWRFGQHYTSLVIEEF